MMKHFVIRSLILLCGLILNCTVLATSFTWKGGTGAIAADWGTASNWNPSSNYPGNTGGTTDTATFPIFTANTPSSVVKIGLSSPTNPALDLLTFQDTYTLNINTNSSLTLGASSLHVNQGIIDSTTGILITINNSGTLSFNNNSTAGTSNTQINNTAAALNFSNSSSANYAQISNDGASLLNFNDSSHAGNSTVTNNGTLNFWGSSQADSSQVINTNTGSLAFNGSSDAGSSLISNGGSLSFNNGSKADQAYITNNTGATLSFNDASTASQATVFNMGGKLDVSGMGAALSIGSLFDTLPFASSINCNVNLGSTALTLGNLNSDDTIFETISGTGGSLTKTGSGTLTLNGNNSYTGLTTVSSGNLVVGDENNPGASLAGNMYVGSDSSLSGFGMVGATTLASNSMIMPGNPNSTGIMSIDGNFTANNNSTYLVNIDGAGNASNLSVTGTAMLINGSTVFVNPLSSDGLIQIGSYDILDAGGVSGNFSLIQPSVYDGTLSLSQINNSIVYHFFGLLPNIVGNGAATYANQQLALAQTADWFPAQIQDRAFDYVSGKVIGMNPSSNSDPSFWLAGTTGRSRLSSTSGGFRSQPKHFALGSEDSICGTLLGLGFAYTSLSSDGFANDEFAHAKGNLFQLGLYGRSDRGDWRLASSLDLGMTDRMEANRFIQLGLSTVQLKGAYQSYLASLQTRSSYTGMQMGSYFDAQPLVGLRYQWLNNTHFTEAGHSSLALDIHSNHHQSVRSELGLALESNLDFGLRTFALGAWEHEFADTAVQLDAAIPSIGDVLHISGSSIGREIIATKLGLAATSPGYVWNLAAFYEGRFAHDFRENTGKIQVSYSF